MRTTIASREKELADLAPECAQHANNLSTLEQELSSTSQRLEALYGKQGRGQQFSSREERNTFLQAQVHSLRTQLEAKQTLLRRLSSEAQEEEASLAQEGSKQAAAEKATRDHTIQLEQLSTQSKTLLTKRNTAQEVRKNSWKELENLQEDIQDAKTGLTKGQQALNASLPCHVSQGLACVERIAIDRGLVASGAYKGPLIDNFTLTNEAFRLAG